MTFAPLVLIRFRSFRLWEVDAGAKSLGAAWETMPSVSCTTRPRSRDRGQWEML